MIKTSKKLFMPCAGPVPVGAGAAERPQQTLYLVTLVTKINFPVTSSDSGQVRGSYIAPEKAASRNKKF
jgi:hypothetical protein